MSEPYHLPTATVVEATQRGDVATVTLQFEAEQQNYLRYPIAPADLRYELTHRLRFPLHQLVMRDGLRLVFETYAPPLPLPTSGGAFTFCSWFAPEALNAVRDVSARWELLDYPDNGHHDHCLLTWETISAYTGDHQGYRSHHGWITVAAYEEYIERDVLHIRRAWRSIENPA